MLGIDKLDTVDPMAYGPISQIVGQLNMWIASTYPLQYVKWQVIFMGVCTAVVLIISHFYESAAAARQVVVFMDFLQIVAGFVYSHFLTRTLSGYTAGIDFYLQFLQRLEHLARILAVTRDQRIVRALQTMRAFGDHAFRPFPSKEPIHNLPPEIVGINPTPIEGMLNAHAHIVHCLSQGKRAVLAPIASDTLHEIANDIHSLERSQMIREPSNMSNHLTYFLILWFGVGVPITMWVSLGTLVTIILYPTVMYALFGVWVARKWLMNVWDPDRPQPESEHEDWPADFKIRINRAFGHTPGQTPTFQVHVGTSNI